jgi:hypothetical protein
LADGVEPSVGEGEEEEEVEEGIDVAQEQEQDDDDENDVLQNATMWQVVARSLTNTSATWPAWACATSP